MFDLETVVSQDPSPFIVAPVLHDTNLKFSDLKPHQAHDPGTLVTSRTLEACELLPQYSVRDGLLNFDSKYDLKLKVVLPQQIW